MTLQHFTIADLQRALHDGELSAREIARQTLDDIARVNPQINAWTEVTAQRMLAEADSIDALRREKRPLPPLAGVLQRRDAVAVGRVFAVDDADVHAVLPLHHRQHPAQMLTARTADHVADT